MGGKVDAQPNAHQNVHHRCRVQIGAPQGQIARNPDVHGDEHERDPEDNGGVGNEQDAHQNHGQDGGAQGAEGCLLQFQHLITEFGWDFGGCTIFIFIKSLIKKQFFNFTLSNLLHIFAKMIFDPQGYLILLLILCLKKDNKLYCKFGIDIIIE
jgi:hypothetical protein